MLSRGRELPAIAFKALSACHVFSYRVTGGLVGHRIGKLEMLLLDHVGLKSVKCHTTPLLYGQDGDDLILVASKWGSARDPAWYRNLLALPRTSVQVGRHRIEVSARTASSEEMPRLWAIMLRQWPGYEEYQRQTDRQIPVVVLERAP